MLTIHSLSFHLSQPFPLLFSLPTSDFKLQGIADLRGKSPRQRAREIIENCAHPHYKDILRGYLDKAEREGLKKGMGHEPQLLFQAYDMYRHLQDEGSMKVDGW